MSQVLSIVASGMVSAVGLSAPASCAAIRCALDNFQETRFIDQGGEWLVGAPVMLPEPSSGYAQLVGMAAMAIAECVAGLPPRTFAKCRCCLALPKSTGPDDWRGWSSLCYRPSKSAWVTASMNVPASSRAVG